MSLSTKLDLILVKSFRITLGVDATPVNDKQIAEAKEQILQAFKESLPEYMEWSPKDERLLSMKDQEAFVYKRGYNDCLTDIKDRLEGE